MLPPLPPENMHATLKPAIRLHLGPCTLAPPRHLDMSSIQAVSMATSSSLPEHRKGVGVGRAGGCLQPPQQRLADLFPSRPPVLVHCLGRGRPQGVCNLRSFKHLIFQVL